MRQIRFYQQPLNEIISGLIMTMHPPRNIYLFGGEVLNGQLAAESDENNYITANVYAYSDRWYLPHAYIGDEGGCFGYVDGGSVSITCNETGFRLDIPSRFWFSTPKGCKIEFQGHKPAMGATVTVFQLTKYHGMLNFGMLENEGRLRYIDGAKDTILHPPIMKGYPCLNALYMPPGIVQTTHTHPSTRAGYILNGAGAICETPSGAYELKSGQIFFLPANTPHRFRTDKATGERLVIVAFHPDSDFGPTHEDHPMLNRTLVEGISASFLPDIQTKAENGEGS